MCDPVANHHRYVSIHPISDGDLPGVSRPVRLKGAGPGIKDLIDLFEGTDLCPGLSVHQVKMKVVVPVLAVAMGCDRVFSMG